MKVVFSASLVPPFAIQRGTRHQRETIFDDKPDVAYLRIYRKQVNGIMLSDCGRDAQGEKR